MPNKLLPNADKVVDWFEGEFPRQFIDPLAVEYDPEPHVRSLVEQRVPDYWERYRQVRSERTDSHEQTDLLATQLLLKAGSAAHAAAVAGSVMEGMSFAMAQTSVASVLNHWAESCRYGVDIKPLTKKLTADLEDIMPFPYSVEKRRKALVPGFGILFRTAIAHLEVLRDENGDVRLPRPGQASGNVETESKIRYGSHRMYQQLGRFSDYSGDAMTCRPSVSISL